MKVWKAFAKSRAIRIICFAMAGALLVASGVGLGHSSSTQSAGEVPGAGYEHKGQFDYTVYLKPNVLYGDVILTEEEEEEEKPPLVFFLDIMDEARLAFSYEFDCSEPTTGVTNEVEVSIIAENPGMWQKEMKQLEETKRGKEFRVDFPIFLNSLDNLVEDIEEDIGISSSQRNFIIRAVVHTVAKTASGKTIEDDFCHEITAILREKTLELKGELEGSGEGFEGGVRYEEEGRFDYEVYLKYNKLYGPVVLRSEELPAAEAPTSTQTLGPGLVYFPRIIDSIRADFSYQFNCDRQVSGQTEEVEVTAIVESPDRWSKSLILVPKVREEGDFSLSFPIDIQYFNEVVDAIEGEIGVGGGPYNLEIKADVHTVAQTDLGTVDEVYTQTLGFKLEGNTLTFDKELSQSQSGLIGGDTMSKGSEEGGSKLFWIIGLVVALMALTYFAWSQAQLRLAMIGAGEAELARAEKKYKQVILDIANMPEVKPNETVIPLSSLDDLVRVADELVKPVLHQVGKGSHIYCIIDGTVRYQYVIQLQDSGSL